jgi:hypothetical protein
MRLSNDLSHLFADIEEISALLSCRSQNLCSDYETNLIREHPPIHPNMKILKSFVCIASILAVSCLSAAKPDANKLPRTPSPKGAKAYVILPKDGKTVKPKFKVVFGLRGMGVCPAGIITPEGKSPPNTGHHHLLVDMDKLPPLDQPLVASDNLKHFGGGQTEAILELKPGKHTLQLVLADFAHIPHNPPVVSEKVTITVEAPKKK